MRFLCLILTLIIASCGSDPKSIDFKDYEQKIDSAIVLQRKKSLEIDSAIKKLWETSRKIDSMQIQTSKEIEANWIEIRKNLRELKTTRNRP